MGLCYEDKKTSWVIQALTQIGQVPLGNLREQNRLIINNPDPQASSVASAQCPTMSAIHRRPWPLGSPYCQLSTYFPSTTSTTTAPTSSLFCQITPSSQFLSCLTAQTQHPHRNVCGPSLQHTNASYLRASVITTQPPAEHHQCDNHSLMCPAHITPGGSQGPCLLLLSLSTPEHPALC